MLVTVSMSASASESFHCGKMYADVLACRGVVGDRDRQRRSATRHRRARPLATTDLNTRSDVHERVEVAVESIVDALILRGLGASRRYARRRFRARSTRRRSSRHRPWWSRWWLVLPRRAVRPIRPLAPVRWSLATVAIRIDHTRPEINPGVGGELPARRRRSRLLRTRRKPVASVTVVELPVQRPVLLSITHNSVLQLEAEMDVGEPGGVAPEHHVARWWVFRSCQVATQLRDLHEVVSEPSASFAGAWNLVPCSRPSGQGSRSSLREAVSGPLRGLRGWSSSARTRRQPMMQEHRQKFRQPRAVRNLARSLGSRTSAPCGRSPVSTASAYQSSFRPPRTDRHRQVREQFPPDRFPSRGCSALVGVDHASATRSGTASAWRPVDAPSSGRSAGGVGRSRPGRVRPEPRRCSPGPSFTFGDRESRHHTSCLCRSGAGHILIALRDGCCRPTILEDGANRSGGEHAVEVRDEHGRVSTARLRCASAR